MKKRRYHTTGGRAVQIPTKFGTLSGPMRTAPSTARVFVSSTWKDLIPEREAVEVALNGMYETKYWGMECFGSHDETPREVSLEEVDRSDLYVGIIGGRYGSGITEEEYRRARKHDLPCLIYFKREAAVPTAEPEPDAEEAGRHAAFKERLLDSHILSKAVQHFHAALSS